MSHPQREEWVRLLCGETDAAATQRLESHLRECSDCAREVNGWRRSVARLDAWKLPKSHRPRRRLAVQPIAWAAAAAIVMGAFVAGRFTAPPFDPASLHAQLKSELSAELQQGFARVAEDSAGALANLELRLASAHAQNNKQLAAQFMEVVNAMREQDREQTEALFAKIQQQYNTDFVLLRRDLENLASATDEEIAEARLKLYQLAANQR